MRIGLVSDTHGLFDPLLDRLFAGCERILHAGDVVGDEVLERLGCIAPVDAVRGNNDRGTSLPEELLLELDGFPVLMVHEIKKTLRAGARIVVHGHSHVPRVEVVGGVLELNPGSAGPRRFRLPRSAGIMNIDAARARVTLHDLDAGLAPMGTPFELER